LQAIEQKYLTSTWQLVQSVFPHTTADDFCRALDVMYHIEDNIRGRHCGNIGDKVSQYLAVIEYARRFKPDRIDCLEIGTLFGGSCFMKLHALKDLGLPGKVVCIDPMSGFYGKELDEISGVPVNSSVFFHNVQVFGFNPADVELRTCMSNSEEAIKGLQENSFAIIMIDGDHSYEGVKTDWLKYSPLLTNDGFLMIDDYAEPAWPYITSFLIEVLADPGQKLRPEGVVGTTFVLSATPADVNIENPPPTASVPLTMDDVMRGMSVSRATEDRIIADLKFLVEENLDARLVKVYLALARQSLQNKRFYECDLWLQKSLFTGLPDPNLKFETLYLTGLCQLGQGLPTKARYTLQIAFTIPDLGTENIFKAILELGNALEQSSDVTGAEEVYLNSLNHEGLEAHQTYDIFVRLANLYYKLNRIDDAQGYFTKAILCNGITESRKFHPMVGLAKVFLMRKRYNEAENLLLGALSTKSVAMINYGKALLELGKCYIMQKKYNGLMIIENSFNLLNDLPISSQYELLILLRNAWMEIGEHTKANQILTKLTSLEAMGE